jgi:hypothetical protein
LTQRQTQTSSYWKNQFKVSDQDLEYFYNQFLENGQPRSLDSVGLTLVQQRIQEEELQIRSELQRGELYQPKEKYEVNDLVVFPRLDYAIGKVVGHREGYAPQYGEFTVVQVTFDNGDDVIYEFASRLPGTHPLNLGEDQSLAEAEGLIPPQQIFVENQAAIRARLEEGLRQNDEFVEFEGIWFLKGLLTEIHTGLLNIVDAAIDINGAPMSVDSLIDQMDMVEGGKVTDSLRFSVNYRLDQDERFENVGPEDQVLWYLHRLTPLEASQLPTWLKIVRQHFDSSIIDSELLRLVREIDDEGTSVELADGSADDDEVVICLSYPHRRAGTLPITAKTAPFVPSAAGHAAYLKLIDGRSGDEMTCWVVAEHGFVHGVGNWYERYELPVGAFVRLKRTADPLALVIDYLPRRKQREWMRVPAKRGNQLSFQMLKIAVNCEYDELMLMSTGTDQTALDQLWTRFEEQRKPLYDVLREIFPELAKLNPQSTVQAKTLYSAVNAVRRYPPGPIFEELSSHDCFLPMGHGYWIYDPSLA